MKDFRKLHVWEKAHLLTLEIYKNTKSFPKDELFGLTSQIRRSSISIPSNLAEGCGRETDAELARFSQILMGSVCELEYQLLLAIELTYLTNKNYNILNEKLIEVKRMLTSLLIKKLKAVS